MNDPLFVGRRQAMRNLDRKFDCFALRQRCAANSIPQRLTCQQLRNDVSRAAVRVPLFIKEGEIVRVNTQTGEVAGRA